MARNEKPDTKVLVDGLVTEKQRTADTVYAPSTLGTILRSGTGAAVGYLGTSLYHLTAITPEVIAPIALKAIKDPNSLGKPIQEFEALRTKYQTRYFTAPTAEEQREYMKAFEKLTGVSEEFMPNLKNALANSNKHSLIAGTAGAGLGLLWQHRINLKKRQAASHDLNDMKTIQESFRSRVEDVQPDESKQR